MTYQKVETRFGTYYLVGDQQGLRELRREKPDLPEDSSPVLEQASRELIEYLEGRRRHFDVKLEPHGTQFQKRVWDALLRIPYGETRTYGELAREIGEPGAVRAVGTANGRNPLCIFIPCHRVIRTGGGLGGYSGGLPVKRELLRLEGARLENFL